MNALLPGFCDFMVHNCVTGADRGNGSVYMLDVGHINQMADQGTISPKYVVIIETGAGNNGKACMY